MVILDSRNAGDYSVAVYKTGSLDAFYYENDSFAVTEVKGADFPQVEVFSQPKGFGSGDVITGKRKLAREIEVSVVIRDFFNIDYRSLRDRVLAFHNVDDTYEVHITYAGKKKVALDCVIKAISYPTERVRVNPVFTVVFMSPHSDLFAWETDVTSFTSNLPMWHDVRVYKYKDGELAFGEVVKSNSKSLSYDGSEPAPLNFEIKALGRVNGIKIKTKDVTLEIDKVLNEGDTLHVSGDYLNSYVTNAGRTTWVQLAYEQLEKLSKLKATFGDNTVEITSRDGKNDTDISARVTYRGRYNGV